MSRLHTILIFFSLMFNAVYSYAESCTSGLNLGSRSWPQSRYGDDPKFCANGCQSEAGLTKVCFPDSDSCTADLVTNGVVCTTDGITPGGSFPSDDGDGGGDDDDDIPLPRMPNRPSHWDGFISQLRGLDYNEYLKARASLEPAFWSYNTSRILDNLRREEFSIMSRSLNVMQGVITPMHENIADIRHKSLDIAKYEQMNHGQLSQMNQKMDKLIENTSGGDNAPCIPRPDMPPLPGSDEVPCIPPPRHKSPEELHLSAIRDNDVGFSIQRSFEADRLQDSVNGLTTKLDSIDLALSTLEATNSNGLDALKTALENTTGRDSESLSKISHSTSNIESTLGTMEASNLANSQAQIGAIQGVGEQISGIHDAMTGVDASSIGVGVCSVSSCESMYEPEYTNGLGGLMTSHFESMKTQFTQGISESFDVVDFSSASRPNYVISLDLGPLGHYGTYDIFEKAYLDIVFSFARVFFMACTIFYCRGLVMGG